jgi:hypothetical protein
LVRSKVGLLELDEFEIKYGSPGFEIKYGYVGFEIENNFPY